jgi:hypothetical protein
VIDASVVPSEGTDTNDRNPDCTFVRQGLIFSERVKSSKGYHREIAGIARNRRDRRHRRHRNFEIVLTGI